MNNVQLQYDNRPIGVFDSGIGGLTVMSELAAKLPDESIIYLGDTARVPYGDKSPETITKYALEDAAFLAESGVKLIIAACNTVSSVALDVLKKSFDIPVYGVIESGAAATASMTGKIAVIGTKTTVASGAYVREIKKVSPQLDVECIACPLLVPLAEEGISSRKILDEVMKIYLGKYREFPPEALLLGCTHYPLFHDDFNRFFSGKVKIISSASAATDMVIKLIRQGKIAAADGKNPPDYRFCVTDVPEKFICCASRFFGSRVKNAEQVSLACVIEKNVF